MRGFRNFCQGVQARLPENSSDAFFFFLVLNLFYSGLFMVYFKENYNFPRFRGGPTIPKGGGPTFSRRPGLNDNLYRNPYIELVIFQGGVWIPYPPPSGSAHVVTRFTRV